MITALAFSSDSRWLAAAYWEGDVKVWEVPSSHEVVKFKVDGSSVHGLAFSPDGKTLATGDDQVIVLRSVDTRKKSTTFAVIWTKFGRLYFRRMRARSYRRARMAPLNCGPLRASGTN